MSVVMASELGDGFDYVDKSAGRWFFVPCSWFLVDGKVLCARRGAQIAPVKYAALLLSQI
jgi:hypothetical protein